MTKWKSVWLFKCERGNEIQRKLNAYKTGNTKSCGCLIKDVGGRHKCKNEVV